jgi:hypothetical protein
MPENNLEEFKFPDEKDSNEEQPSVEFEIEIEDDTPPEDRGREPMPKSLVEELEQDELENYDENVKQKLKQMRKVWHDERREKEQASESSKKPLHWPRSCLRKTNGLRTLLRRVVRSTPIPSKMPPVSSLKWLSKSTRKPMILGILIRLWRLVRGFKLPIFV